MSNTTETTEIPEHVTTDKDIESMAIAAYEAYGQTTNFKNFQGNPMPLYTELPEPIKNAWRAAAMACVRRTWLHGHIGASLDAMLKWFRSQRPVAPTMARLNAVCMTKVEDLILHNRNREAGGL